MPTVLTMREQEKERGKAVLKMREQDKEKEIGKESVFAHVFSATVGDHLGALPTILKMREQEKEKERKK